MQKNTTAIVWFTTNLRVRDNRILREACFNYDKVIGVYCFDENMLSKSQFGFRKISKFRAKFLLESVKELSENLETLSISNIVAIAKPSDFIPEICKKYKADALFVQKEFSYEEVKVIESVKNNLSNRVKLHSYYDQFMVELDEVPFQIGDIPYEFSNFRRKVEKYSRIQPEFGILAKPASNLVNIAPVLPSLEDLGFDDFEQPERSAFPFKGGENQAMDRLHHYFFKTKKLGFYLKTRNGLLGTDYSSKFSPWLAVGAISPRTIYWRIKDYETEFGSNKSTYWLFFELLWRDFFKYIALRHENNLFSLDGIKNVEYHWNYDEDIINEWIEGTTPEPFVNANMIELKQTGWMSNRGRQNVASYFAKELKQDWRVGAAYFESMLIDYDVHSNYGNWQYVAGVGNDPRDRKFNVQLQAKRYDARGTYQSLWLQPTLF